MGVGFVCLPIARPFFMIKDDTIIRVIKEVAKELNIDYDLAYNVINTQINAIEKGIADYYNEIHVMGFGTFLHKTKRTFKEKNT